MLIIKPVRTISVLLVTILLIVVAPLENHRTQAAEKTVVMWFVGLGSGMDANQIEVEKQVVADFNKSQDTIELKLIVGAPGEGPENNLKKLIKDGVAPDIVGPVSMLGADYFPDHWLDLRPLIAKAGYNIKQFPDYVVNLYEEKGTLVSMPFAIWPGLLYFNRDLFDAAGLAYPPTRFGEKYNLDGKEVDWDYDTVATIAKRLTLDDQGRTPDDRQFDAAHIIQYGFIHQWDTLANDFATFGAAPLVDAAGKVSSPQVWQEKMQWLWNGLWKDHFIPDAGSSVRSQPYGFATGKVAMARTMLWYNCCVQDLKARWDIAPVPMYKGHYYAPADSDGFRIMKESKNPDAAFKVLQYLVGQAAFDLLTVYDSFPARSDLQDAFIKKYATRHPSVKNWAILAPSLEYATDSFYPNSQNVDRRFNETWNLLYGETGQTLDIDKALADLQADVQILVNKDNQ